VIDISMPRRLDEDWFQQSFGGVQQRLRELLGAEGDAACEWRSGQWMVVADPGESP
jgi:hypothetical protein